MKVPVVWKVFHASPRATCEVPTLPLFSSCRGVRGSSLLTVMASLLFGPTQRIAQSFETWAEPPEGWDREWRNQIGTSSARKLGLGVPLGDELTYGRSLEDKINLRGERICCQISGNIEGLTYPEPDCVTHSAVTADRFGRGRKPVLTESFRETEARHSFKP
jgi:hypothetical protein